MRPSPGRRAVLVLGAGRSGTSIVTRALQAVGVDLGNDFKPPSRKNPTGFFEDRALLGLSKKLRRRLGLRPDSLRLLDDAVWTSPEIMPLYDEFEAMISGRFGHTPVWGFKYGRTMRLLPFWLRLLARMDISPSYVMPIRSPLSVARSRARLDSHRGGQENSDLEWLVNVVPYFERIRGANLVVVDYDRLVQHPVDQLRRMAERLNLPITDQTMRDIREFADSFLKRGLRHTRFTIDDLDRADDINVLVRDAYRWLDRL
ncbi:MAG: sulfotransferase family protein, partial [Gammaproteobacteria bacterium]